MANVVLTLTSWVCFYLQVLSRQSRDPQATESKCHFRVSRVKVAYDFDGPTMYHAVNPRDDNSSFIRSSKSGNITLRKRWRFDCGAWMYFNDSIPSCSSDHLRSNK